MIMLLPKHFMVVHLYMLHIYFIIYIRYQSNCIKNVLPLALFIYLLCVQVVDIASRQISTNSLIP